VERENLDAERRLGSAPPGSSVSAGFLASNRGPVLGHGRRRWCLGSRSRAGRAAKHDTTPEGAADTSLIQVLGGILLGVVNEYLRLGLLATGDGSPRRSNFGLRKDAGGD
jgi:hypothetical protein